MRLTVEGVIDWSSFWYARMVVFFSAVVYNTLSDEDASHQQ
jgi:hypothetical protein